MHVRFAQLFHPTCLFSLLGAIKCIYSRFESLRCGFPLTLWMHSCATHILSISIRFPPVSSMISMRDRPERLSMRIVLPVPPRLSVAAAAVSVAAAGEHDRRADCPSARPHPSAYPRPQSLRGWRVIRYEPLPALRLSARSAAVCVCVAKGASNSAASHSCLRQRWCLQSVQQQAAALRVRQVSSAIREKLASLAAAKKSGTASAGIYIGLQDRYVATSVLNWRSF